MCICVLYTQTYHKRTCVDMRVYVYVYVCFCVFVFAAYRAGTAEFAKREHERDEDRPPGGRIGIMHRTESDRRHIQSATHTERMYVIEREGERAGGSVSRYERVMQHQANTCQHI